MIGLSNGYHRAMVHMSQCHAMSTMSNKFQPRQYLNFNINILHSYHSLQYLNLNISLFPQHNSPQVQLNIQLSFLSSYISNHYLNNRPIYPSHHSKSIAITKQDNIYMYQSLLYKSNRVWKAPDSLFCIKITFQWFIYTEGEKGFWKSQLTSPSML